MLPDNDVDFEYLVGGTLPTEYVETLLEILLEMKMSSSSDIFLPLTWDKYTYLIRIHKANMVSIN